ncbi:NUDIX hydrolase [Pseudoflavonifractor sp. 60]|uniref:NUDIX domain-containing protein n=1 Tax=Pseudoflavonifractor sp. 60 TaxID=2304576 RepID=UPI001370A170|nr:NUDIX hydrolase [Pseudoflavonifractor sp. 60]NBI66047.1 NUDIX hydrolase [Pseudoflavonifractor sp. 60]
MNLAERRVHSDTIFEGKIIKVTKDQAELPDGSLASREVVNHPGGVCVLALDEDSNVTLVKQFRYPIQQLLLELPAGKLEYGEEHGPAAVRELSEETGLEASEWTYLGYMLSSPGFCTEKIHMYLARGLTRKKQHLDEGEFLDVLAVPFEELIRQVMDGTITDGKTVTAALKTKVLLGL